MKKIDQIYWGFSNVGVMSFAVVLFSITGYYILNEVGIKKYNGLFSTLIPIALVELTVSIAVVNLIDYTERNG